MWRTDLTTTIYFINVARSSTRSTRINIFIEKQGVEPLNIMVAMYSFTRLHADSRLPKLIVFLLTLFELGNIFKFFFNIHAAEGGILPFAAIWLAAAMGGIFRYFDRGQKRFRSLKFEKI